MRLFAVFYQCLSVMHIVLARSSGVKSKVLATSCNTHNIGLQYMIGCLMIAFSVLPFSVITNQRFPCSFWFQSWSPLTCRNPRGLGPIYTSHLLQSRAWGGKKPPNFPRLKNVGSHAAGDQWSCCHDRRSDPFGRSSTSDAGKVLWMFLGTLR